MVIIFYFLSCILPFLIMSSQDTMQFVLSPEELAKEAGKMKVEGKNYDAVDGDIFYFKFNTADPVKKK